MRGGALGAEGGDPHRRAWALHRQHVELHLAHPVVAALVGEALAGPRAQQDLQALVEARALLLRVEVEARVLVR